MEARGQTVIVVDTDVIAYAFIRADKDRTELADGVRRRDADWAVPPLWLSEFRNVLATLIRFRGLSPKQALHLSLTAESQLAGRLVPVQSTDVLGLVSGSGLSAYDCEFVAAARALDVRLVTGDRRVADAFPESAVTMEAFAKG